MCRTLFIAMTALCLMAATGCSRGKSLQDENAMLLEENETLRAQLDDRNSALDSTSNELRDREIEISELNREIGDLLSRPEPVAVVTTGFEGIQGVTGSYDAGEVTATVESDILFDSGKTTLRGDAKSALNAVASVLNSSYAGKTIRISGHTDSDPIRKSGFKSNYHLAFDRGYAVRDYLVSQGVSNERIYLASYGPDQPRGSKAQCRRVEIVVVLNGT
jgi:flagellar motor protein MotB